MEAVDDMEQEAPEAVTQFKTSQQDEFVHQPKPVNQKPAPASKDLVPEVITNQVLATEEQVPTVAVKNANQGQKLEVAKPAQVDVQPKTAVAKEEKKEKEASAVQETKANEISAEQDVVADGYQEIKDVVAKTNKEEVVPKTENQPKLYPE